MSVRTAPTRPIAAALPWAIAATLWLLPLVAMQFTDEVRWDMADFAVFGAMLLIACGLYELARRTLRTRKTRAIAAAAIAGAFVLLWAELAVGLFH